MIRVALAALLLAPAAFAETYQIDPSHSQANFTVKHMMVSKVHGTFHKLSGTIDYDEKAPEKTVVNAEIDASSVSTGDAKRDGHLKTPDFFDVANHPKIIFKSKKVTSSGPGKFSVLGDLTLRGVTKEVTLDVEGFDHAQASPWGTINRGATATTKINRKDFGVSWQKDLDKGGVVVSDEVQITLEIEAVNKPEKSAAQ
jgi:polyisoprenoid-binding protein YceI